MRKVLAVPGLPRGHAGLEGGVAGGDALPVDREHPRAVIRRHRANRERCRGHDSNLAGRLLHPYQSTPNPVPYRPTVYSEIPMRLHRVWLPLSLTLLTTAGVVA